MIVKQDETRNASVIKRTLNGFLINVNLEASQNNTLLLPTQYGTSLSFDASQVNVKAVLKRNGKDHVLFHDNLGILGQYNSILCGSKNWFLGTDIQRPDLNSKHKSIRTLFVYLGGHLNVGGNDEVCYEVTVGRNSFNLGVDPNACYVQVTPHYSIGKESGVFMTKSHVIQANATRESFNLGDNVSRIAFLNFEDTGVTNQLIQNVQISTDRVDWSFNFADILNIHQMKYGYSQWLKMYDYSNINNLVDSYQQAFPQSFILHDKDEFDSCALDIAFNGNLINASKNYIVYSKFITSMDILRKSARMVEKHTEENLAKISEQL